MTVLTAMGATAVPALLQALGKDPQARAGVFSVLNNLHSEGRHAIPSLRAGLGDSNGIVRSYCAHFLGQIGPDAVELEPALIPLVHDPEARVRFSAIEALAKIGCSSAEYVYALIQVLEKDDDMHLRAKALWALSRVSGPNQTTVVSRLVAALGDDGWEVRRDAARALGRIRPAPDKALSALVERLGDRNLLYVGDVANALASFGRPAVPHLIRSLRDEDWDIRAMAAVALGSMGPLAVDAVPILEELLEEAGEEQRWILLKVLVRIQPDDAGIVHDLVEAFQKRNYVSLDDVDALAKAATVSDEVLPCLLRSLQLGGSQVQARAGEALGAMGSGVVPQLVEALKDREITRRGSEPLQNALARIGRPAVLALVPLLKDKDPVSRLAATTLGQIGNGAVEAIPQLIETFEVMNNRLRYDAAVALARIGPASLDPLLEALELAEGRAKIFPIAAIGEMGPGAAATVPALVRLLDTKVSYSKYVADALAKIGPDAAKAVSPLARLVREGGYHDRRSAVWALRAIGVGEGEVVPALVHALTNDPESEVRLYAAITLSELAPDSRKAMEALLEALDGKDERLRAYVATGLGRFRTFHGEVTPVLVDAVRQGSRGVRRGAAEALGLLGLGTPRVSRALRRALRDKDNAVRQKAVEALGRLNPKAVEAVPDLLDGVLSDRRRLHAAHVRDALRSILGDP